MTWGAKRQLTIVGTILLVVLLILAAIIVPRLNKEPTCFDGKQNGDERGLDCGGKCARFCPVEVSDVKVHFARSFPITADVWSAVAYIENQNVNAGAYKVKYEFRLYDEKNQFITVREGETFIGPNATQAVYETGINVANRAPKFTTFKLLTKPDWIVTDQRLNDIALVSTDQILTGVSTLPRFRAMVKNTSELYTVDAIAVIAILYDIDDNAVAIGKTFIETLSPGSQEEVFFTWPGPFPREVIRTEIVIRYNPFTVAF